MALEIVGKNASEKRLAVEALFFPRGRGELQERHATDSRRTAALDALATAESARERLLAGTASDAALDDAEAAVKRAARAVEREIAAAGALVGKEEISRKAEITAAWERFFPPYAALQNEFAGHLRAALSLAEKIRRINSFVEKSGAVPATECLPYPSEEILLVPVIIEGYFADVEKAIKLNEFYTAKRSAAA